MRPISFFLTVFLCLALGTSSKLSAHEFEITTASILVHSNTEFSLVIEADLIELFTYQLGIEGAGEEMIRRVQAMTPGDVHERLAAITHHLNQQVEAYIDGEKVALDDFDSPTAMSLYQLIQRPSETVSYRAEFSSVARFNGGKELQVQFPEHLGTVSLVIASPKNTLLMAGELSNGYQMQVGGIQGFSTKVATAVNYAHHGFLHVLPYGLDHILFVVALCLLATRLSALVWQVSAFTLAHTLTLGLSSAGFLALPSSIVEPIIALSIAWVAFENLFVKGLRHWRILIIFLFGLIHGLGFASALQALGLSPSQWLTSLVFFNIGVELGQLSVVFMVVGLLYWWRDKAWYTRTIQIPACTLIGLTGLYWAIERVFY